MGNETVSDDASFSEDLYKLLLFVGGAIGLIMYVQVLKNRQHWVVLETVLGLLSLALFPFARSVISNYVTYGPDNLSVYLFRLMALARVSQATSVYLTRRCTDPTVTISVSTSNILSRGMKIICALHGLYYAKFISQFSLKFDLASLALLIFGDLFYLRKLSTREGSLTVGDPISLHLSIDALLSFMLGAWTLGFPDMYLKAMNPVFIAREGHLALVKVFGSMIMGGAVLSFASLCFKDTDDAASTLQSKIVIYVPAVFLGLVNYGINPQYRGLSHTGLIVAPMAVLAANACYALWKQQKEKEKLA